MDLEEQGVPTSERARQVQELKAEIEANGLPEPELKTMEVVGP